MGTFLMSPRGDIIKEFQQAKVRRCISVESETYLCDKAALLIFLICRTITSHISVRWSSQLAAS